MRSLRLLSLSLAAALLVVGIAPAQYTMVLANSSGTAFTNNATINATALPSIDFQVFLVENNPSAGGTNNTLLNTGLIGAGAVIRYTPTGTSLVASAGDVTIGSNWPAGSGNNSASPVTTARAQLLETVPGALTPPVKAAAGTADRILLGTFHVTRPATGGNFTLTVDDPKTATDGGGAGPNDNFTGANNSLDSQIAATTYTLQFTAVPEPGSMALCGLAAVGFAAFRRRRKAAAVETTVAA